MHTSKLLKKLAYVLTIAMFLSTMFNGIAFANNANPPTPDTSLAGFTYNTQTEIRPDIGQPGRGNIGQYGYKVFQPGAIASVVAMPMDANQDNLPDKSGGPRRRGSTDAWLNWVWNPPYFGFEHFGAHHSSSDLSEDEIWVDGFLKITNDSSWRDTCSQERSGKNAYCVTSFFQVMSRSIQAKSDHHFHLRGYKDNDFSTADGA
ncbi:MAG: hypothetical protein Fur0035_02950 [Anaerolineales bacterium]